MSYSYSDTDKKNIKWMQSDDSCATLNKIVLKEGWLRGLNNFEISFKYPIAAIAGENGSGKSTLLAMAACAFHYKRGGYVPSGRKYAHYTFSEFFVQSKEELPPEGIHIRYQIHHNKWRKSKSGLRWQSREKRVGGRWTDYANRVSRNVIYFGVQRVVPHFERSASKSNRQHFRPGTLDENSRRQIQTIAGKILGRNYESYDVHKHSKYSLPIATYNKVKYSGFNMGAGESAIFEILTALFDAGQGTLLVIDELELGLHEKAQRRLVNELKELCKELHCQIICSTHSHIILDELPPEGRFYIENGEAESTVFSGISSAFACGKLSGNNSGELDIFVEDAVAEAILAAGLPHSIRQRVNIFSIGSSGAVLRQLASRYLEKRNSCFGILDGDKEDDHNSAIKNIAKYSESSTDDEKNLATDWASSRIFYLPGDTWPEKWLIETAQTISDKSGLLKQWKIESSTIVEKALEEALIAGKHDEFYQLSKEVKQSIGQVRTDIIRFVIQREINPLQSLVKEISKKLEEMK